MENMDSGSSLDMDEVINMNEQCLVFKETELWKENVDLIEKSNLGNTVSSSYEISAPTNIGIKLGPGSLTRRRDLTGKLHLLNVEHDGADNPPYLFDRHAPSRISTSPTLRRLRKNTSSVSQIAPLQDNVENIRIDEQMPQINIFLSMHPELPSRPQHCSLPSTSGIYSNTVTQVQHSTSVNPTTNLLDNKGDFSDTQTVQNSRENNPSPECEGKNSQQYSQDKTWHEMLKMYQLEPQATSDQLDTKKKEAVWELFTTECNYFLDHLLVLKKVTLSFVTSLFSTMEDLLLGQTPSLDFTSVLTKWCERNKECKRLRLAEMLVAPLHKLTRYPLLLKNIWKNTDAAEKVIINSLKEKVETSILAFSGFLFPHLKSLKYMLRDNPHENILSPTKRSLVLEGRLILAESMRFTDVYLFLFDDLLLITKPNRYKKKFDLSLTPACSFFSLELQSLLEEGGNCIVLGQPIPLDRMMVKNIDSFHITVAIKEPEDNSDEDKAEMN
ncbi:Pleckstrin-likey domain-containing family G member 7, partial [Ophiophagus hannah]